MLCAFGRSLVDLEDDLVRFIDLEAEEGDLMYVDNKKGGVNVRHRDASGSDDARTTTY